MKLRAAVGVCGATLNDDIVNDVAGQSGEAEIATGIEVGQPFVVKAEQMKDGRVKIMNVYRVLRDLNPVFVGCAIGRAATGSPAS